MRMQRAHAAPTTALWMAIALLAVAVPAAANHDAQAVGSLNVAVYDHNGNEVTVITPHDPVMLPPDEPIQLRMFEQLANGERRWIPTEFRVRRGSEALNHTRNRQSRGEVTVELYPDARVNGPLYLDYTILSNVRLANETMRRGSLQVQVADTLASAEADRLIGALYRGVLLREPDQQGMVAAREAIRTGGWNGLVRFAQNTANSRESEMDVYEKGACNQQRLIAMYRELQGRELRRVDQRTFRAHLEQLERGDIDGVVVALMETPEFQDRFGLRTAWRR
jgi:hypothetical protein